jgi:phosphoglycolate phosphatase
VSGTSLRCLCFDFDGTLVDSFSLVLHHYARIAPEFGCRVPDPQDHGRLRGLHAKDVLAHLGVPVRRIPRMVLQLRAAVRADLMELAPVPGIPEAVAGLAGAGYRLGIISSNAEESIRAYLKRHRMRGIDFVATSNVLLGKAKVLGKVARSKGIPPGELLYVADELRDLEAARKAGCRFAAVAWGYTDPRTLERAGAELVFRSPAELVEGVRTSDG